MNDLPSAPFPQQTAVPPIPPRQRRRVPPTLVTAVIGLMVGALAVGVPWLLLGGGDSTGGSSAPLTAPSTLGSLESYQAASAHLGSKAVTHAQQLAEDNAQSAKLLSAAYGGAAALVTSYSDDSLNSMALLLIVRADSPQPFVQYENLKELGFAEPENQLERFGPVSCVIDNEPPVQSGPEPPSQVYVTYCQRSGPGLTIQVRPNGPIQHTPDQVAGLVNEAWNNVH